MSIEAMKQALEALESATPKYTRQRADQKTLGGALDYWKLEQHQRLKAITSLRQAIAEAEQDEPMVWKHFDEAYKKACFSSRPQDWIDAALLAQQVRNTHPQPKREWVGLTDEDIGDEYVRFEVTKGGFNRFEYAVRAIEAKLKEKNT